MIYWNNGKGRFARKTPVGPPNAAARAAAAGNLNGDGRLDIMVGDERQGVFVYVNQGKREFESSSPAGYAESRGSVYLNDGTGINFREVSWGDGKGAVYGIAIADLDGDGWPDIAAARSDAPNAVWFSTGKTSN
jgi:hypothetical protein